MTVDASRLRILVEVARHGSMTGAASAMAYTPSAISQQIRQLEIEAGQPVLERHPRGVTLTDAGEAMVQHALMIERQLEAMQTVLDDIAGLRAGSLRFGTFPTVGASLLPLAVTQFQARHPGVDLKVQSGRLNHLLDLLERRRVELALLWDYEWSRVHVDELDLLHLMDDPSALVVARTHRLADQESARVSELAEENWIIRGDQHPVAEVLSRTARAAGFDPVVAFEANDYQEAQAMVAVGLGIALVPKLALANVRHDVHVLSLGDGAPRRRILLARLASRVPTPPETAMTEILTQLGKSLSEDSQTPDFRSSAAAARAGFPPKP